MGSRRPRRAPRGGRTAIQAIGATIPTTPSASAASRVVPPSPTAMPATTTHAAAPSTKPIKGGLAIGSAIWRAGVPSSSLPLAEPHHARSPRSPTGRNRAGCILPRTMDRSVREAPQDVGGSKLRLALRTWFHFLRTVVEARRHALPEVVAELETVTDGSRLHVDPRRLGRIVAQVLRIGPWRPRCLYTSLVLFRLLREQGDRPVLVIGLPKNATGTRACLARARRGRGRAASRSARPPGPRPIRWGRRARGIPRSS